MHSILLVVDKPTSTNLKEQAKWSGFADWMKNKAAKDIKDSMIAEYVFLLPGQNGLGSLSRLVTQVEESKLRYRVLFFEKEPSWITS